MIHWHQDTLGTSKSEIALKYFYLFSKTHKPSSPPTSQAFTEDWSQLHSASCACCAIRSALVQALSESLVAWSAIQHHCHDRDIRSPCTLLSDRIHAFAVHLLYVLPFPFLSICPVSPLIGERIVRSVSLYDYLICFRSLYVPVPFHY